MRKMSAPIPLRERRKGNRRLLWIAPPSPGIIAATFGHVDRRLDHDGAEAAIEISRQLISNRACGIIFGILKCDGRFEMGTTGALFDHPLLAAGIASHLGALMDSWREHPSLFLPDFE